MLYIYNIYKGVTMLIGNTCCFFGHRTIDETEQLKMRLRDCIEKMITELNIDTFLFGSKSRFNDLCVETVTALKEKYPHIQRIYVRAEFPCIDDDYKNYLSEWYDDTYYPENIIGAGKSVYVQRNCEMIRQSRFCVVYFDEKHLPDNRKSGTKIAYDYAVKQGKHIIQLP